MKKIGILACVLIVLLLTSCKSTSLQAILRDKPFDWTDSFEYDFMYHDQKYDLQSIESLSEEQLNAYYEAPPVTVYLVWDSDTQIGTIYEEKQPDANEYYLLDLPKATFLLYLDLSNPRINQKIGCKKNNPTAKPTPWPNALAVLLA